MNPTELINPRCKITGTTPVVRSTRHVFLDLPKLAGALGEYIESASKDGGWSSNCLMARGGRREGGGGGGGGGVLGGAPRLLVRRKAPPTRHPPPPPQVTNAWMRDGLKTRCITRDLNEGIPVPLDGYRDKVGGVSHQRGGA